MAATDVTSTKPVHSLVLDAGPIIKNDPAVSSLIQQAECLYTVPAVVNEIRDVTARQRVETTLLPFLTLRSPQPSSIKVITDFARKTGDLEVLSKPDIQIMALAYELECERNHGDWRLRSNPGQKRLNGAPPASLVSASGPAQDDKHTEASSSADAGVIDQNAAQTTVEGASSSVTSDHETTETTAESEDQATVEQATKGEEVKSGCLESICEANVAKPITEATSAGSRNNENLDTSLTSKDDDEPPADLLERTHLADTAEGEPMSPAIDQDDTVVEEIDEESEVSDGEGWITPSNVKKHKAKDGNGLADTKDQLKTIQVATLTTDFAMQNVLLRMNLNLISTSLQTIKQLKTWVLRCHGCFYISKDMTKQFCPRCGKPTLMRTSCSTDQNGNFKVHLKKNMQWNTRGNVFSIPKPTAGTTNGKNIKGGGKGAWGHSLILAEDQKEYVRAVSDERRRKEKDLMDEDYLPSILTGDRSLGGGKPKVGAGRNVNSRRRR